MHARVLKAAVYTNFNQKMFEREFRPKLERMGIEIIRVIAPDKGYTADVSDAEILIALIVTMSHGQFERIQTVARNSEKPLVPLGRKSSGWVEILERYRRGLPVEITTDQIQEEQHPMGKTSVDWDKLSAMTAVYMNGCTHNLDDDALLTSLQPFWTGHELRSRKQLELYISRLVVSARCPPDFRDWYQDWYSTGKQTEHQEEVVPALREVPPEEVIQTLAEQLEEANEFVAMYELELEEKNKRIALQEKERNDLVDLLERKNHELASLAAEVAALKIDLVETDKSWAKDVRERESEIAALKFRVSLHTNADTSTLQEIETLRAKVRELEARPIPSASVSSDFDHRKALTSLKGLIELGLMNEAEAFEKLCAYAKL